MLCSFDYKVMDMAQYSLERSQIDFADLIVIPVLKSLFLDDVDDFNLMYRRGRRPGWTQNELHLAFKNKH